MVVVLPSDTTLKICPAECHEVNVDGWRVFHNVLDPRKIGPPVVPIPVRRTSSYRVTTGSVAEDSELRRIVSLEIDEATSQLLPTSGDSASVLKPDCRTAAQQPTAVAQR
jgi:hypothetical protein